MTAQEQMVAAVHRLMTEQGVTQAELARRTGRTPKHISKVLGGTATSLELDYWLWCLGYRFNVTIEPLRSSES